jgi:hypothetical protein
MQEYKCPVCGAPGDKIEVMYKAWFNLAQVAKHQNELTLVNPTQIDYASNIRVMCSECKHETESLEPFQG